MLSLTHSLSLLATNILQPRHMVLVCEIFCLYRVERQKREGLTQRFNLTQFREMRLGDDNVSPKPSIDATMTDTYRIRSIHNSDKTGSLVVCCLVNSFYVFILLNASVCGVSVKKN